MKNACLRNLISISDHKAIKLICTEHQRLSIMTFQNKYTFGDKYETQASAIDFSAFGMRSINRRGENYIIVE
tara:strand:+ start:620 stop:835 length:216 start_codon:yes stop_codon:yes gene_type:complete